MTWRAEEVPELRGYTVEWAEPGNYYLSRRNEIFHSPDLKPPFKTIAAIDAPAWRASASRSRLIQRLLRFMVTNLIPLDNGEIFVTFDRAVGSIRDGKYRPIPGLVRPCRVLRSACAADASGNLFFGEYLANDERGEVRIYRSRQAGKLDVMYTFPAGSIRHVHGIYFDKFSGSLFCLTGDHNNECQILRTSDEFATVETVGKGDETWRAVSMLFSERFIHYGMDAEFRDNEIFRMDRQTLRRDSVGTVTGTVFYSKQIGQDLFFATTAENAPAQKENVAALWHLAPDETLTELAKFKKDRWHTSLFQFGTIHFPYANLTDTLYFHLVGVVEDNRTYRVARV